MNLHQQVAVAIVDVAVIVELCISMYIASAHPENFTVAFVKSFFVMLLPTLIAAKVAVKRLRSAEPEPSV